MVDIKTNLPLDRFHYERSVCNQLASAEALEWLVTNGIGGFATGTIANL
jgi:hypothetical protein